MYSLPKDTLLHFSYRTIYILHIIYHYYYIFACLCGRGVSDIGLRLLAH